MTKAKWMMLSLSELHWAVFFLWMQVQTLLFHSAVGKQRERSENLLQIKAWKAREISDRWSFRKYSNWFFEKFFQLVWGVTWVSLPVSAGSAAPSCPCYLQVRLGRWGRAVPPPWVWVSPAHPGWDTPSCRAIHGISGANWSCVWVK